MKASAISNQFQDNRNKDRMYLREKGGYKGVANEVRNDKNGVEFDTTPFYFNNYIIDHNSMLK